MKRIFKDKLRYLFQNSVGQLQELVQLKDVENANLPYVNKIEKTWIDERGLWARFSLINYSRQPWRITIEMNKPKLDRLQPEAEDKADSDDDSEVFRSEPVNFFGSDILQQLASAVDTEIGSPKFTIAVEKYEVSVKMPCNE